MGDSPDNCIEAMRRTLDDQRAQFIDVSALYTTSPVSPIIQPEFVNSVLCLAWTGSPEELLHLLESIEQTMGRKRIVPQGPRVIDLDILLFGDAIVNLPDLTIPHPEMHRRKFTIVPCLEIDPQIVHPLYRRPLKDFLPDIAEDQRIEPIMARELVQTMLSAGRQEAAHAAP